MVSFVNVSIFMSLLLTAWMFLCGSTEFVVVSEILSCKQNALMCKLLFWSLRVYLVHKAFWKLFCFFTHFKAIYCRLLYSCIHAVHFYWTKIQGLFCFQPSPISCKFLQWQSAPLWPQTEIIQHVIYQTKRVYFPVFYNGCPPQVQTQHDTNS